MANLFDRIQIADRGKKRIQMKFNHKKIGFDDFRS